MMQLIRQRKQTDCGIATLAMITGHSYDNIIEFLNGCAERNNSTWNFRMSHDCLMQYLSVHGYAYRMWWRQGWITSNNSWPPPLNQSGNIWLLLFKDRPSHWVVPNALDMKVYDPARGTYPISDIDPQKIAQHIEIWKVNEL